MSTVGLVILIIVCSICTEAGNPSLFIESNLKTERLPFGKLTWQKRTNRTFRTYRGFSLINCVTECFIRRHCGVFTYQRQQQLCELHGHSNTTVMMVARGHVIGDITSWSKMFMGTCYGHRCPNDHKCIVTTNETIQCVISECPELSDINYTTDISGLRGIGDIHALACNAGFDSKQYMYKCSPDGSWTIRNKKCSAVSCGDPEIMKHADMTETGRQFEDNVTYTCVYDGVRVNRTCLANGSWSDEIFDCPESTNVALNKHAYMSSQGYCGYAKDAVDGNHDTVCDRCAHSALLDTEPWLAVDLNKTAVIRGFGLLNRNVCELRLSNITIDVGVSMDAMKLCAYFEGPGRPGVFSYINCTIPRKGSSIRLSGWGFDCAGNQRFVQLCELIAYGFYSIV